MIRQAPTYYLLKGLLLTVFLSGSAQSQGLLPVPDISGATVSTEVITIPPFGEYEYRYTINVPASANGTVWLFEVDVSAYERTRPPGTGSERRYPIRDGAFRNSMRGDADLLAPFFGVNGREVVVVNQIGPPGWNGGMTRHGFVQFTAGDSAFAVQAGMSASGFILQVDRPPTIRRVDLTPDWVLLVDDHDQVTEQEVSDGAAITASLPLTGFALGPLDIAPGGHPHYGRVVGDINTAGTIGWVSNPVLIADLQAKLSSARGHVSDGNNAFALSDFQGMLAAIAAADQSTFNTEFRLLVDLNVESFIAFLPFLQNTNIPVFEATPERANLPRGDTFTWTLRHFNSALESNPPIAGLRLLIRCVEDYPCANLDALTPGATFQIDASGQVEFSYVGGNAGFDLVEVVENDFEVFRRLAVAEINWNADADLVIPAFVPPIIGAMSGDTIFLTDRTENHGTIEVVVPTITRYYISTTEPVDVAAATVLGDRAVPPLGINDASESLEVPFVIPPGFDGEVNYLAACADAGDIVVEADESNNCSFSEFEIQFATAAIMENPDANSPPTASSQTIETDQNIGVLIVLDGQDADADALTFSVTTNPSSGQLTGIAPDLSYTPNLNFTGVDSFTFIANDGTVDSNVATVLILVNPVISPPPTVNIIDASILEGNSGQQILSFDVSLTGPDPVNEVSMTVSTIDGSAVAGEDYEATSVQIVFVAGTTELTQSVTVNVLGDFDVESDEDFSVELSNVSPNVQIGDASAVGIIENDDLVSVTIGDTSALEGNSGNTEFAFEIGIDQAHPTESVYVNTQTADGSALAGVDYVAAAPLVTFAAGTTTLSQSITVNVVGDLEIEPDESFSVQISGVSLNAIALVSIGSGIILNDDTPLELDCGPATASPNALWPPNHKLVNINIGGVLSENGDPAFVTVTGIEQDEPVNGLGDGDISPDGFGVGTGSPQVRRERSGTGDGRLYLISFSAIDANSAATCTGVVGVGVPHDQGQGSTPIDSGVRFDSTVP